MAEPMYIGVDIGGQPRGAGSRGARQVERFRMAAEAGVFDFVETQATAGGDLRPYFDLVDRYALPVRVIDGTWGIGRDEALAKDVIDAASRVGSKVLNLRLPAQANGAEPLSDDDVVAFYLRLCEWGDRVGCVPSLDACSVSRRDRTRVARLGERIARAGFPFRVTVDHADLPCSDVQTHIQANTEANTHPNHADAQRDASSALHADWIDRGWVYHVRTRGVPTRAARRARIDTPASRSLRGDAHVTPQLWAVTRAEGWKRELRQLIRWQANELRPRLRQITCAFASPAGRRGDAGRDALSDNVACAHWLRDTWLCQMERRYGHAPHTQRVQH
ncbi:xylose isomerase [Paraburkholderia phosphatilytica]|uniref:xylose isomerase n=1 Tax=Paraburkholderia phosphatilytica TaxID=2282883 RepID=UPI000E521734|nr:xylose isomerase [Paraburkholderia phosphatilytica]